MTHNPKNIYITMLGRSIWAVLNSYYAVLKEKQYYPDEIILIAETIPDPEHTRNLELTKQGLALTSSHFGISPAIHHQVISEAECKVKSDDAFIKAVQCLSRLIKERKKAGYTVALDITPGRKTLVTGALLPITLSDVDHVFYLSVRDITPAPFMMIPFQTQHINDFKEQAVRAMHAAEQ
ncbi:MAG: hypothetical protein SCH39_08630 [Methanosarcinales archaeon]|nr:hypothetical protein [Methanosarcinales archaeon]